MCKRVALIKVQMSVLNSCRDVCRKLAGRYALGSLAPVKWNGLLNLMFIHA